MLNILLLICLVIAFYSYFDDYDYVWQSYGIAIVVYFLTIFFFDKDVFLQVVHFLKSHTVEQNVGFIISYIVAGILSSFLTFYLFIKKKIKDDRGYSKIPASYNFTQFKSYITHMIAFWPVHLSCSIVHHLGFRLFTNIAKYFSKGYENIIASLNKKYFNDNKTN